MFEFKLDLWKKEMEKTMNLSGQIGTLSLGNPLSLIICFFNNISKSYVLDYTPDTKIAFCSGVFVLFSLTNFTQFLKLIHPLTPDSVISATSKFSKIPNRVKLKNKQHHSKVLLNIFPM